MAYVQWQLRKCYTKCLLIEIEFSDKESKDVSEFNGDSSGFKDDESGEEDVALIRGQGGRAKSHLIEKKNLGYKIQYGHQLQGMCLCWHSKG